MTPKSERLGCEALLYFEPAMIQPFSLLIFVADGDSDGLRIVDKSNWIGKTLVFPRAQPLRQIHER